jgi:DNA-binding FadR family transcriptional regulator
MSANIDQIVAYYRELIAKGELKPGQRLPGVARTAQHFNTTEAKAREAYNALQDLGIVERRNNVGTFVFDPNYKSPWDEAPKPKRRLIIMIDMGGELIPAERRNIELDEATILSIVTPKAA